MAHTLLLHGALGSAEELDAIQQAWPTQNECISIDFVGHGKLANEEIEYRIERLAEHLLDHIHQYKLDKVEIFGYSMGGYVALYAEYLAPGSFAKISTLGTKFNWSPEVAKEETKKLKPEKIQEKVPKFAKLLISQHGYSNWQKVVKGTADLMTSLGENPLLTAKSLAKIKTPCLIMRGELDHMITQQESHWAANSLPNGEFVALPEVHHPMGKVPMHILIPRLQEFHTTS